MKEAYIAPFFIYGTLSFVVLIGAVFILIMMQNKRRYKYEAEKKEREYQYRNELLNAQLEQQEILLNQVSKEIHDNVGQVLSLIKVHLYTISNIVTDTRPLKLIETSAELLDKAIDDLRNISHTQNADLVQHIGLKEVLHRELNYISGLKNKECEFEVSENHYLIPAEQELIIYRIAQEAIHNSIKHAKSTRLKISLDYQPGTFTITIADNGIGFNISDKATPVGIGLLHMRQRAKLLNAKLEIDSQKGVGTIVTLIMPTNI